MAKIDTILFVLPTKMHSPVILADIWQVSPLDVDSQSGFIKGAVLRFLAHWGAQYPKVFHARLVWRGARDDRRSMQG